jgi:hypothetical protein
VLLLGEQRKTAVTTEGDEVRSPSAARGLMQVDFGTPRGADKERWLRGKDAHDWAWHIMGLREMD